VYYNDNNYIQPGWRQQQQQQQQQQQNGQLIFKQSNGIMIPIKSQKKLQVHAHAEKEKKMQVLKKTKNG
jgi:hypothetical protein